jgi:hypothetical protein
MPPARGEPLRPLAGKTDEVLVPSKPITSGARTYCSDNSAAGSNLPVGAS